MVTWSWRRWLPTWLGGVKPPKKVPQTFMEFLRENKANLGLVLQSSAGGIVVTYYRTGVSGSDFAFTVNPAEDNPRNTEMKVALPTSDKRENAARPLKQAYNRYLATNFAAQEREWPKVELKN